MSEHRKLKLTELNRLSTEEFHRVEKNPLVVVLDNIRSHHNVGSIFRTADAFRIEKIILCGFTPVPPHREIHKTALGATDTVKWEYMEKTMDAVVQLKLAGYKVYAVEQAENSTMLDHFPEIKGEKTAVVFGHEVNGVGQEVMDSCDGVIEVPQQGTKHSLNISVCAGIVMWELFCKLR
ncbi:MAG: RNA methyltransferase [Bacteroidota bacterium]